MNRKCAFIFLMITFFNFGCTSNDESYKIKVSDDIMVNAALEGFINKYLLYYGENKEYLVFQLFCIKNTHQNCQFLLSSQISLKKLLLIKPSGVLNVSGEPVLYYSGFSGFILKNDDIDYSCFSKKTLIWDEDVMRRSSRIVYHGRYDFTHPSWLLTYEKKTKIWSYDPCLDTIIYGNEYLPIKRTLHLKQKKCDTVVM